MALDPSTAAAKGALSVEEAERLAARYRPSWEVDDPIAAGGAEGAEPEVDLAGGAQAQASEIEAPDTLIEGIPTISVGAAEEPAAPAPPGDARDADRSDEGAADLKVPRSRRSVESAGASGAAAVAPPAPPGKTKVGLSDAHTEPHPAPPPRSTRDTGARESAARPPEDAIEIPVSGGGKGPLLKVAIAAAVVAMLFLGGRALIGSDDKAPAATPEPTAQPATTSPAPTAAQPAPPDPPPTAAPATATAAPTAAATATAAPTAAPTVAAVPPTSSPAAPATPTQTARPAATPGSAAGAQPPPGPPKPAATPAATPPSGGKKGGGIIRDAPF